MINYHYRNLPNSHLLKIIANSFYASKHEELLLKEIKEKGNWETINDLVNGRTALYEACLNGFVRIAEYLLAKGARFDSSYTFPLYNAVCKDQEPLLSLYFRNYFIRPDSILYNGCSLFHVACRGNHLSVAKILHKFGANADLRADDNSTPLYVASEKGHHEIVAWLLSCNLDPNSDRYKLKGYSPLYVASQNGYARVVKSLLDAEADATRIEPNSSNALYISCERNHLDVAMQLMAAGANPNKSIYLNSYTPLYVASQNGFYPLVKLLVKHGADVNHRALNQATPLQIAFQKGHFNIVLYLIHHGADVNHEFKNGYTLLENAYLKEYHKFVNQLILYGAQCGSNEDKPLPQNKFDELKSKLKAAFLDAFEIFFHHNLIHIPPGYLEKLLQSFLKHHYQIDCSTKTLKIMIDEDEAKRHHKNRPIFALNWELRKREFNLERQRKSKLLTDNADLNDTEQKMKKLSV